MMTMFVSLSILGAAALQPASVAIEVPALATSSAATKSAELAWLGAVRFDIEYAPDEVVVRFDRPLADSEIEKFTKAVGAELSDFRWNDSSLVLRPAAERRLVAVGAGNSLRVEFFLDRSAVPASPDATVLQDDALDRDILRAQADAAAGYNGKARRQLIRLAQLHPENTQIQRALADAEVTSGAVNSAALRYRTLAVDDYLARRAIAESSGGVGSEAIVRSSKSFTQKEGLVTASAIPLSSGISLGGGLRHVRTRFETVENPLVGVVEVDASSTIADVTAAIRMGSWTRIAVQGSALLGSKVAGLGTRLTAGSQERQLRLTLAYHLPDVSTGEQARYDGHISRIAAGGTLRMTPELTVQADAARNGYGLGGLGIRTRTIAPSAGVDYLIRRNSPSLALTYRFDAEYVTGVASADSSQDSIPLSDRENHTAQLSSSLSLGRISFTGFGGWTKDRAGGGGGPTAGTGAVALMGDIWRLEANGGISSVSRPGVSGRQLYLRMSVSRYLKRR